MFCYPTYNEAKKLRSEMRQNGGKMSFWKTLDIRKNTSVLKLYHWYKGVHDTGLTARKARTKDIWGYTIIERGFHVFTEKPRAEVNLSCDIGQRAIIEVECDIKDFIGADYGTAVFTKVTITPRAWKSYLERRRKIMARRKK